MPRQGPRGRGRSLGPTTGPKKGRAESRRCEAAEGHVLQHWDPTEDMLADLSLGAARLQSSMAQAPSAHLSCY